MAKPFKGVISDWYRDGDVIVGRCQYHADAKPMSPEAFINNWIVQGEEMHTSKIERMESRETFTLCETKNSVYILTNAR